MRSVSSLIKRHNKAFKSDSQRLAISLRSSIAKRRSHLNAALCFNHVKSVGCIFYLLSQLSNFALVGKLHLVVAVFWTPIRGREKF